MTAPVALSIVIVNYETPDYTIACIRSIRRNPPACAYEILLIDNGSCDGSLDRIREADPGVVCIETGRNTGFSRANNLGIHNASGEFILLLNSDTEIRDNALDRMLECLLADRTVGAIGPKQLDGEGRLQLSWGRFPTLVTEAYRKIIHQKLSVNDLRVREYLEDRYAGSTSVDWISGSCLMARRKALFEAGLLDERYFMYFEDVDLCRRITDRGWTIRYEPDIVVIHFGGVSAKKNLLRVLVEYRRSQIHFTRTYYGWRGVAVLKTLLVLKYAPNLAVDVCALIVRRALRLDARLLLAKVLLSKKTLEMVLGRSEPA